MTSPPSPPHPPIPLYADRVRATLIGRGPHCHVNIAAQDPATAKKISRRHALIVWDSASASFRLCVLGLNGVLVNGVARFADDDDDDDGDDNADQGHSHGAAGQGIELKRGTIMEFPGGVRFEFMGERTTATKPTKTLVSSPMRGMSLAAATDVEVEVQGHEQVEDALDAVQGLLSLAASSASSAPSSGQSRSSLAPSATVSSSAFKPPRAPARPLPATTAPSSTLTSTSTRRDPLLLQIDDHPEPDVHRMELDPGTPTASSANVDGDSEFDPDQTLPAIDILSARLCTDTANPPSPTNENQQSSAPSVLTPLPQTPVRSTAGKPAPVKSSPNHTDSDPDSDDSLSSSASTSPTHAHAHAADADAITASDPHGPPPMPLLDILVESFTFCARSDLSLAELLSEIRANQVYFRTHPCPARWHAQVVRALESHRMFALRPRNKWLKKATQWYYDPDRDHDQARAARFREFGSAQPARRAKRRAETQYYVKDMTGKPVSGSGASRGPGGVKIVVDENEDEDDEDGSYVKMDAGKRAAASKKQRTMRDDDMVMPSSDATVPGSPVMRRYADVVETKRTRGASSGKKEAKAKVIKGKQVSGVRLDLE
ncbi:hypothetical protein BCR44DRAFT_1503217 [Catenaria anguillulae PL171]|uniref:FHA domain-containing protein n=1 Tax=Catenaria anguillulae PL171 TaxID=765915 RepID=A0A1Y2H8W4_9FUNG|nr:hypothetical protein BCR44DRAFT_1503217 [Catenaria anguillulae PL171]